MKKGTKAVTIKFKLIFTTVLIICVMGVLNLFLMASSMRYNNQYAAILTNINTAQAISVKVTLVPQELFNVESETILLEEAKHRAYYEEVDKDLKFLIDNSISEESSLKLEASLELIKKIEGDIATVEDGLRQKNEGEVFAQLQTLRTGCSILKGQIEDYILFEAENSSVLRESISSSFKKNLLINIVALALTISFSIATSLMISENISKPVNELRKKALHIASGNLEIENVKVNTKDELVELANAFNDMVSGLKDIIRRVYHASTQIHNLSSKITENTEQNNAAGEEISASIQEMVEELRLLSENAGTTAHDLGKMFEITQLIAAGSEKILGNANNSVSIASEGSGSIEQFILQLGNVNSIIQEASDVTEKLNISSNEMNKITNTITSISSQTNLLALNASIEAARAGDVGKGFAVVAGEVKKLADEAAESARRIEAIIKNVQQDTKNINEKMKASLDQVALGNTYGNNAKEHFESIEKANRIVNSDIVRISKELRELNKNAEKINIRMEQVDKTANANMISSSNISATVEQQAACLEDVSKTVVSLSNLAGELDQVVKKFKI